MRFIRNYRGYVIVIFLTDDYWFDAKFKKIGTIKWRYAKTSFHCAKTEIEDVKETINELEYNPNYCWSDERKRNRLIRRDGKVRYNS